MKTFDEYKALISRAKTTAELNKIAYEAWQEDPTPEDWNFEFNKTAIRLCDRVLNLCLKRESYLNYCRRKNIHI